MAVVVEAIFVITPVVQILYVIADVKNAAG